MKKNIGNAIALYPTPRVVVGAMVNGKPNRADIWGLWDTTAS